MGCGDWNGFDIYFPPDPPYSSCPDPMALNYNWLDCSGVHPNYDPADCPWETNNFCKYCEDVYETEEERYENCCNIATAENFIGVDWSGVFEWNDTWDEDENNSSDSTYCIFE